MATEYDHEKAGEVLVVDTGVKYPSSNWSDLKCPFCKTVTRAYWWSLAAQGKKCQCGSLLTMAGEALPPKGKTFNPDKRKFTK